MENVNLQRIAVLIDADNTQSSKIEAVLKEVSALGRIVVKKAFGNWKKETLKNWESEVKRLAIKTEQQFDYVKRKNATDLALVIDAMDLLHEGKYDGFVLIASDSDYTPLAIRLRESGAYIVGVGEKKTPESFLNSCDKFLLLEDIVSTSTNIKPANKDLSSAPPATDSDIGADKNISDIEEIHNLLRIAARTYQDDSTGLTNLAPVGSYLKRAKPDYAISKYGYSQLTELLDAFPRKYFVEKQNGVVWFKCLQ